MNPHPIICPDCGRHLGLVDKNSLIILDSERSGRARYKPGDGRLYIECVCGWRKNYHFKEEKKAA